MKIPILIICVVIVAICTALYNATDDDRVRVVCTCASGVVGGLIGAILVSYFI